MAAQGLRDVGDGRENVANQEELAQLRQQGRTVMRLTYASTAIATLLLFFAAR